MKLFAKYNRINIIATIATFIAGSVAFYFVLYYILIRQLDGTLKSEEQEIVEYVQSHNQLPDFENTRQQWITASEVQTPVKRSRHAHSITVFNKRENENEQVRQITFSIQVQDKLYNVTVNRSQAETEDLLQLIILVTLGVIGMILLVNYFINRKVISRLWQPFYNTIGRIKGYTIAVEKPLQLPNVPVDEIALLNDSLNQMTLHIYRDYHALKAFTENASHEMQTPLAVIRSKVELLLQDDTLTQENIGQLLAIENAASKLSRLHQSLLLLTKLENRQFIADEPVNLRHVILARTSEWQDLISSRNIKLAIECGDISKSFHQHLAEILVNNLLSNALRYTPGGGKIDIVLNGRYMQVANTAPGGALDEGKVFTRFYKAQNESEGTGLGLAIIKEICNLAGFSAMYTFENDMHIFTIYFGQ
ncbi:MAG TPA: HAMP domain-containing sensor histidine kinase [Chitinophagaceae bacterium]|nr:HAMP domain-containing sensor histidine kinase [Chitinophagaceae bacterium]